MCDEYIDLVEEMEWELSRKFLYKCLGCSRNKLFDYLDKARKWFRSKCIRSFGGINGFVIYGIYFMCVCVSVMF